MPYCGNTNDLLGSETANKYYQIIQKTGLCFTAQNAWSHPTADKYVNQLLQEAPKAKDAVLDRLAVVTGVTKDSMGYFIAQELALSAEMGVVLLGRSMEKLNVSEESIREEAEKRQISHQIKLYKVLMDLDDLATAVSAAKEITKIAETDYQRQVHILVNNAGSISVHLKEEQEKTIHYRTTKQGVEANTGRNFLAPHLLTHLLVPILEAAALPNEYKPRVVFVSSMGHCVGADWSPEYFSDSPSLGGAPEGVIVKQQNGEYTGKGDRTIALTQYARSKIAILADAKAFQERYPHISFTAVHPGSVASKIGNDGGVGMTLKLYFAAFYLFQLSPSQGARSALRAVLDPDFNTEANLQGAYLHCDGNPWPPYAPTLENPGTRQAYEWQDYANDTYDAADKLCTVLFYNK